MEEQVILVNEQDLVLGTMGKMQAHLQGKLHRAFSVFIFNTNGELLLQQRAFSKYHSGGKWTNTCCSHPKPQEETIAAAHRRLQEEMGMQCTLTYGFNFLYEAKLDKDLIEHEFDHVYYGISDSLPNINLNEVADFKYLNMETLEYKLSSQTEDYTEWLKICFPQIFKLYKSIFKSDL